MHLIASAPASDAPRIQLLGSGTILREVLAGAELLEQDFGIVADVWSATSFNELRRDGMEAERWSRLHPTREPRKSWVHQCLGGREGPVVASTDYMRTFADQIRPYVDARYEVLGTDGYGRSDTRAKLRAFFEIDRRHVAVAALHALAQDGTIEPDVVQQAIDKYDIDSEAVPPWRR
jgi:pyruvate dehydrogenase E1 component